MRRQAPKSFRLHVGLYGARNAGKSSLLNALTRQDAAIVSSTPGTTTDPVEKPMELQPLGPVLFIDTAGLDDEGALGAERVRKSRAAFDRTDLALILAAEGRWTAFEESLAAEFKLRGTPCAAVFSKCDLAGPDPSVLARLTETGLRAVSVSSTTGAGLGELRRLLVELAPEDALRDPAIVADLVGPGEIAVLVVPIDKEAPKGRLIMPQVQSIRDLLDHDACALVVKERELRAVLERFRTPPRLVVTDSQAFLKFAADTPPEIRMTSFSILFARLKGDLCAEVAGALAIERLKPGARILVAEACSHHPITEDIGRVKIPRWLTQYVGGKLAFTHVQGHDFPADLTPYKLVIHCGACTFNRRLMLSRIAQAHAQGVPLTNYGLAIAFSLGIFERALAPFPAALDLYRKHRAPALVARTA